MEIEGYKLIDCKTGLTVNKGDTITDFRGDVYTVTGGAPPHKASSCGYVYTVFDGSEGCYYVNNFSIVWVKI